jgi:hypothetical protein
VTALPLLLSAALSAAPCPPAAARCSCVPPGPPREALAQAEAVFAGRVVSVGEQRGGDPDQPYLEVRIVPDRRWKGAAADTVTVRTPPNSAVCGVAFETGREYLVYAEGGGGLRVFLCSRTAALADAGEDLAALGAPAATRIPVRKEIP